MFSARVRVNEMFEPFSSYTKLEEARVEVMRILRTKGEDVRKTAYVCYSWMSIYLSRSAIGGIVNSTYLRVVKAMIME